MPDQPDTEAQRSAGGCLKGLREERGLSVADVSARIYLQKHVIDALERDDYDSLPVRAYVYGYLRSYAKFLNVPPEHVLSLYKQKPNYRPPTGLPATPAVPLPATPGSNRWLPVLSGLFPLVLALGALGWWYSRSLPLPPPPSLPLETGRLDYPITIVEHPRDPFFRAPNTEDAGTEPAPAASATTEPATARAQPPDTGTASPAPASASTATPFTEATIVTGSGPDRARLVVNDNCWVEVFDADNNKVFYDLARAGQTLQLRGTAPFSVLLGNADAATVEFNNLPFDFTPHITGIGLARFVLGATQ